VFPRRHNCIHNIDEDDPQEIVHSNPSDPFSKLPQELKNMVLFELPSRDIASLRLASRAFHQLSKSLFKHLLQKEMPWFWEIDQLEALDFEYWKKWVVEKYGEDLSGLPVDRVGTRRPVPAYEKQRRFARGIMEGVKRRINWLRVYEDLKILDKGMLGVRNRVRIWKVIEEIVKRIGDLRESQPSGRYDPQWMGGLGVEPTDAEKEAGAIRNGHYCPMCSPR